MDATEKNSRTLKTKRLVAATDVRRVLVIALLSTGSRVRQAAGCW
jgi:hypothetical protein